MAVTLESVMRMNDQFSVTLSKYYTEVENAKKKTDEAQVSGTRLGTSFHNIATQSGTASSGIHGIVTRLTTMISTVYLAKKAWDFLSDSIHTAATQQVQQTTFQSLMGSQQLGSDLYQYVSAYAQKSALDRENVASATTSFLAYTKDINQLQQLLDLTQRLYMFNPAQGAEGATFALKEVLSGQTMSLRNRFNMTGISADTIKKNFEKGDISSTISYLDKEFNKFGATQDVVSANFQSLTVQASLFKTNLMSAIGDQSNGAVSNLSQTFQQLNQDMDAGKFQPFFSLMATGTSNVAKGFAWVAQNANILAPILAGVTSAILIYNSAMAIAGFVTTVTGTAMNAIAGNVIGVVTALGAVAAAAATYHSVMGNVNEDNSKTITTAEAMEKFRKDQKSMGASTLGNSGVPNVNVSNKDPIKVTGSVEIATENLKYVFEASTAKFYAMFNATSVTPQVRIDTMNVHETTDLDEVDNYLGNMVSKRVATSSGGVY